MRHKNMIKVFCVSVLLAAFLGCRADQQSHAARFPGLPEVPAPKTREAGPRVEPGEGLVPVEGGTVWYKVFGTGSGTPLLMLHGGPGAPSEVFEPLAKRLGRDRPVIIYDQLGTGRSRGPHDTKLWTEHRSVENRIWSGGCRHRRRSSS